MLSRSQLNLCRRELEELFSSLVPQYFSTTFSEVKIKFFVTHLQSTNIEGSDFEVERHLFHNTVCCKSVTKSKIDFFFLFGHVRKYKKPKRVQNNVPYIYRLAIYSLAASVHF